MDKIAKKYNTTYFLVLLCLHIATLIHINFDIFRAFLVCRNIFFDFIVTVAVDFLYVLNNLQYVSIIILLYPRFKAYNRVLNSIKNERGSVNSFKDSQKMLLEILRIIELINEGFGIQMMITAFSFCMGGILEIFSLFEAFVVGAEEFVELSFLLVYYVFFDRASMVIVFVVATLIEQEVNTRVINCLNYSLTDVDFIRSTKR